MLLVPAPGGAAEAAVWVGCDDGRVLVYHPTGAQLLRSFRPHGGPVQALALVGGQVGAERRFPGPGLKVAAGALERL